VKAAQDKLQKALAAQSKTALVNGIKYGSAGAAWAGGSSFIDFIKHLF